MEDAFRENLERALAAMTMAEFPLAVKQVLLYIKSTVESLSTVRAQTEQTSQLLQLPNEECMIIIII